MEEGYIDHTDGVSWIDAPLPKKRHRCWAQTEGVSQGEMIWRCPCGGIKLPDRPGSKWAERNTRGPEAIEQLSFMGDLLTKFIVKGKRK